MTTPLCRVLNWGVIQILTVTVRAQYTQVDLARNDHADLGGQTIEEQIMSHYLGSLDDVHRAWYTMEAPSPD